MSTNWHPVINYEQCEGCGRCIEKCGHGVYDSEKKAMPKIVDPESCIEGCHGCGNLCPNGAITYAGENTNWTPPTKSTSTEGCCSCGGIS